MISRRKIAQAISGENSSITAPMTRRSGMTNYIPVLPRMTPPRLFGDNTEGGDMLHSLRSPSEVKKSNERAARLIARKKRELSLRSSLKSGSSAGPDAAKDPDLTPPPSKKKKG